MTEAWIQVTVWDGRLIDERSTDFTESTEKSRERVEKGRTQVIPCFEIGARKEIVFTPVQAKTRGRS